MKKTNNHTFIILAYKKSPYLESCILSLLKQTLSSHIIISTSTPSAFISKLAKKYNLPITIGSGGGIAADWNHAYNHCQTKYLTLAHQDDIYLPNYLKECLDIASKNNLVIFTNYSEINEKGEVKKTNKNLVLKRIMLFPFYLKQNIYSHHTKRLLIAFGNPFCCPSAFFNHEKIGKFGFKTNSNYVVDWDAWLRLSKKSGGLAYNKNILMHHRIHRGSETSLQITNQNRFKEEKEFFSQMWPKWFANIIYSIYIAGSKSNIIK